MPARVDQLSYLATLRLVPDDVILETATREFRMDDFDECLVGWLVRAGLGREANLPAEDIEYRTSVAWSDSTPATAARLFGGETEAWRDIFGGVERPRQRRIIEADFAQRVAEAAGVA